MSLGYDFNTAAQRHGGAEVWGRMERSTFQEDSVPLSLWVSVLSYGNL